jgi:hypothetical protein
VRDVLNSILHVRLKYIFVCSRLHDTPYLLQKWVYTPQEDRAQFGLGAVLLVNEKPQGLMSDSSCYPSPDDQYYFTPRYEPIYSRLDYSRDLIISAADGNVDNN